MDGGSGQGNNGKKQGGKQGNIQGNPKGKETRGRSWKSNNTKSKQGSKTNKNEWVKITVFFQIALLVLQFSFSSKLRYWYLNLRFLQNCVTGTSIFVFFEIALLVPKTFERFLRKS